jgi:hypothetical protein
VALARNLANDGFDLWVGAPGDDVDGVTDAGSVSHFALTGTASTPAIAYLGKVGENTAGVPGAAEAGDRFGASLSATRFGVLVGEPGEDVGGVPDAGSVTWLLTGEGGGAFDRALTWSQASPGVSGEPENGDRFGASVSAFGGDAVVGVPSEDVGSAADAGMVQTLRSVAPGDVRPAQGIHQDSPGVPGVVEPGDRFGASVVLGRNMTCLDENTIDAAIGAPTEDVSVNGRVIADAGAVTVLIVRNNTGDPVPCPARAVDQNAVLDGLPEAGDRVGASLGLGRHREDEEEDVASDVAYIGVPNEDIGTVVDAGTVQVTQHGSGFGSTSLVVAGRLLLSAGHSGNPVARLRYGTVLATPAGD